jgi:hypothetical protein
MWGKRFDYAEAAPHLIMMAFLQRVINGGGQIRREMAAGSGRLDLCLVYEGERYPIELKLRRDTKTLEEGLAQTARYIDTCGCGEGWLALFDLRKKAKWRDKLFIKPKKAEGVTVHVVGL